MPSVIGYVYIWIKKLECLRLGAIQILRYQLLGVGGWGDNFIDYCVITYFRGGGGGYPRERQNDILKHKIDRLKILFQLLNGFYRILPNISVPYK